MVVKPGCKQTEVGVIPEEWDVETIENAFEVRNQLRLPLSEVVRERIAGPYPYYGPTSVQGWINEYRVEGEFALIGEDGDHFLKWRSQPMTLLVRGKFNVNNHAHLVQGTKNLTEWFYWFFANRDLTPYLTRQGAGRYKLTKAALLKIPCALPSPSEQRAIAETLSDVDELLGGLDRLIAKKRDLKQAAIQQLLTGQTRLPGFHDEWEETTLGEVATLRKGKGLPKSAISEHGAEPCIHYGELFTQYSEAIRKTLNRTNETRNCVRSVINDVLMPTSDVTPRGLAKASCVLMDGVILGGDILIIRSDRSRVFGTFLSYVIRREESQVLQLVTGTTVYHLYGSDMKNFTLSLPSVPEQAAIAEVLSDIDAELVALELRREKARALKQAMMQELLTGKTRLV